MPSEEGDSEAERKQKIALKEKEDKNESVTARQEWFMATRHTIGD